MGVFLTSAAGVFVASFATRFFALDSAQATNDAKPTLSGTAGAPQAPMQPTQASPDAKSAPANATPTPLQPPQVSGGTATPTVAATTPKTASKDAEDKSSNVWSMLSSAATALAWPIAALLLVRMVLKAPQIEVLLNYIYRRTSQISILGFEIKLSEGAKVTIEDVKTLIRKIPESHQTWVHNTHLLEQFRNVIVDLRAHLIAERGTPSKPILEEKVFKALRFTIHVPDIVFAHSLRQLVDYTGCGRGGAGRLFSIRRGIMGKAWRLQKSCKSVGALSVQDLVELWGMTLIEAEDTSSEKDLLWAFVLKDAGNVPVGLLYIDGKTRGILPDREHIVDVSDSAFNDIDKLVQKFAENRGLVKSLKRLENARVKVPQLDIFAR